MSKPNETLQKTFDVHFTRMVSQSTVIRVTAADKKSASALAWAKVEDVSKLDWEDGDVDGTLEQSANDEVDLAEDSLTLTSAPSQ